MAIVKLDGVCKIYDGKVTVVKDVNLEIKDKEFMVLVGPSGCGKSTTLRMIAGLEEISAGTIQIDDRVVNDVAPKDRDIAMVFQNYALYPHMSVYDNMAFGLKLRKTSKAEINERVMNAAKILSLEPYLDRKPKALSGGQRQRVAVGRAIVRNPSVFLFDEPLSNLDAKMRVQMRTEISKLHNDLQATMIYVTHDQIEAMTMGDRICVMKDGVIQQVAEPLTIYEKPANKFVASFIGTPPMNFFDGKIVNKDGKMFFVNEYLNILLPNSFADNLKNTNLDNITLGIRPEHITPNLASIQDDSHKLDAKITLTEPMGAETYLYLQVGDSQVIARVDAHVAFKINEQVSIPFDITKSHIFCGDSGICLI